MFLTVYLLILTITCLPNVISSSSSNCSAKKANSPYDYIVIGSGPGGATVATRLASNNFVVLLIEAGPDYDDITTQTPVFWPEIELNPQITAQFNPYLYSEENQTTIQYPRGITLGGSAQINAMIMMLANPSEWDYIANVTNDSNWSYENIKTNYIPLVENCQYCTDNDDDTNTNGWLNISISNDEFISSPLFSQNAVLNELLTVINASLPFNPNVDENNTYDSYYYSPKSVTEATGIRSGTYKRIKNVQAMRPSNLHIWTNTFVTKLVIDPQSKDACGVEYIQGSYLYKASPLASPFLNSNFLSKSYVYAKREIIVSGGQWMSPQLLQLSGIGDSNLLNQFNIEIIQNLTGVGQNQQDRNEVPYIVELNENPNLPGPINPLCILNGILDVACLITSLSGGTYEFESSNIILFGILRSAPPIVENFPDTAFYLTPLRFDGFRQNWVIEALPYTIGSYLSVIINFARVQENFGTVRIRSTNAFDTPIIEMNHLTGENAQTEINQIIDHIRFLRNLFMNSSFSEYVACEDLPGSGLTSDEQLAEYIYQYAWGHHACCTNKMGNTDTDTLAVVNGQGQVKGISNLRIVDISIFPKIPGYFPTLPIAVAAEKIAHDIIQAAGN